MSFDMPPDEPPDELEYTKFERDTANEHVARLTAAIAERDQRIAELEASEVRARHNLCELMTDLGQEPDRNDPTLTPCVLAFQASVFVKQQRHEMQERIAELERERDQLDVATYHLSADLKAANLTIRTMGERCDKLAGLLRRWVKAERQIGPLDTTIGTHTRLITETETLLREVGQ